MRRYSTEVESAAEALTAATIAAAVREGPDAKIAPAIGKKSAFEATSQLEEPLSEDNVGRRILKKIGWEPLLDPATGDALDEAPVPIPQAAGTDG